MDIKIHELSKAILKQALEQARTGRLHILERILETIQKPRSELSPYAPKVITMEINPAKIGEIIGPGGKIIRAIQSETNTRIEIDDSGLVKIAAASSEDAEAAQERIADIVMDPEVGAVYEGHVVKVTDFGAFVQIRPGTEGLVHISQLDTHRVKRVSDVVKEGDPVKVKVLDINRDGKIRLSRKAVLEAEHADK
jgi:polyribonucleotide nucleotidyltransferase